MRINLTVCHQNRQAARRQLRCGALAEGIGLKPGSTPLSKRMYKNAGGELTNMALLLVRDVAWGQKLR
jgi:hypothetical protein